MEIINKYGYRLDGKLLRQGVRPRGQFLVHEVGLDGDEDYLVSSPHDLRRLHDYRSILSTTFDRPRFADAVDRSEIVPVRISTLEDLSEEVEVEILPFLVIDHDVLGQMDCSEFVDSRYYSILSGVTYTAFALPRSYEWIDWCEVQFCLGGVYYHIEQQLVSPPQWWRDALGVVFVCREARL